MLNNGMDKCSCINIKCRRNGKCEDCLKFHKERNSLTKCQREIKKKEKLKINE